MIMKLIVATAVALSFCASARADICNGPITAVAVQNDGQLIIRHANKGHWLLCNVEANGTYETAAVSSTTCRNWLAVLIAAHKAGTQVSLYTKGLLCKDVGDWQTPGVYYIEDMG